MIPKNFVLLCYPVVMSTALADWADDDENQMKRNTTPAKQDSIVPQGWRPTPSQPVPVVRCTVTSRESGERCKRWSIRGSTVCIKHGGQLPNVQEHAAAVVEAARLRLVDLAQDAVDGLESLFQPGTAEGIRLKAYTEVLDRAGIRGGFELDVEVTANADPRELIARRLKEIRDRTGMVDEPHDVIDGEVVPDAPEQDTLFDL